MPPPPSSAPPSGEPRPSGPPRPGRFEDKFLSKLGKIDRRRIRDFVARLVSRKDLFESVFEHLNEGIVVCDDRLRILYSNPFARRLLDWPPRTEKHFGEDLAERCPPGGLQTALRMVRDRGRVFDELECALRDGDERRVSLASTSVRTQSAAEDREDGIDVAPARIRVLLIRDVTERRRRDEDRARAHRLSSLALLTSGLAHEIKNPLNSLDIHAQILRERARAAGDEGVDRETVERATSVILEETGRLARIVDDFIQSARPRGAVLERHRLDRIVEELVRVFEPECERAGVRLETDLDPDVPPLLCDPRQLFQALRNLVKNAIEAIAIPPASGPAQGGRADAASRRPEPAPRRRSAAEAHPAAGHIAIRTRLRGDRVVVEVQDDGPGIPEADLNRVFEPYYTTKPAGTGLGLMIVVRVVAEHGGSIHVDSRPGQGTRFEIELPLAERPTRLLEAPDPARGPAPVLQLEPRRTDDSETGRSRPSV